MATETQKPIEKTKPRNLSHRNPWPCHHHHHDNHPPSPPWTHIWPIIKTPPPFHHHHNNPQLHHHEPTKNSIPKSNQTNSKFRIQKRTKKKKSSQNLHKRNPPLPQPSSASPHPPLLQPIDLTMPCPCRKKHHHRDLATPRSTTNRPPLHIKRNREWETERQSESKGERTEGERELEKEMRHWERQRMGGERIN